MNDNIIYNLEKQNDIITINRREIKAENYYKRCKNQCKIVIDCDFSHLINEKQGKSLCRQIMQAYGASRRSDRPISLTLAGVKPGFLMNALVNVSGYPNWLFTISSKSVDELCSRDDTIFLSADSIDTLTEIDDNITYVIGGIVDRNLHKGLFNNKANELGFKSMRLPIRENINLIGSHILNVSSVFDIFLKYYQYNGDWEKILLDSIPQRKISNIKL